MPECYVTKRGYHLECDRLLHREWVGGQNGIFFSVKKILNLVPKIRRFSKLFSDSLTIPRFPRSLVTMEWCQI